MKKLLTSKLFVSLAVLMMTGVLVIFPISSSITHAHAASSSPKATTSCLQPPANANPLTLSDAQLASYGWPNHATMNENPQHWVSLLNLAKHHFCGFTTIPLVSISTPSNASCPQPTSECNMYLWTGNEAQGNRGTYNEASVEFNLPSIPTSPTNAQVAIWAGVGGDQDITAPVVLAQAGVAISVISKNSQYVQHNETFWEVANNFAATNLPLNKSLSVNDDLFFDAQSNSLANPGENYFFVEDKSNGGYADFNTAGTQYNILSDSATGECIVERPNGQVGPPLAQFQEQGQASNTVLLTNCDLSTSSQTLYPIGSYSHHYDILIDNNGNQMDALGPLTNGGANFTVTWKRGT